MRRKGVSRIRIPIKVFNQYAAWNNKHDSSDGGDDDNAPENSSMLKCRRSGVILFQLTPTYLPGLTLDLYFKPLIVTALILQVMILRVWCNI